MLGYLCLQYNYKYNKNITINDFIEWNLEPLIGKEGKQIFHKVGFFSNLKTYPNTIKVLEDLSKKHEILIITNPPNAITAWDKYETFKKILPFIPKDNIIMTAKKELINVDLIFDDSPIYLKSCRGKMITVAMDRLYNKNVEVNFRIFNNNWLEFESLIKGLEVINNKKNKN
jgi:5'(3')-deoxyribonucleotidase